jgi:hypothetical protein
LCFSEYDITTAARNINVRNAGAEDTPLFLSTIIAVALQLQKVL